jgi:hypothetical protein
MALTSVEICAGAGGQAIGLEEAGFKHLAVVELDPHACATLTLLAVLREACRPRSCSRPSARSAQDP